MDKMGKKILIQILMLLVWRFMITMNVWGSKNLRVFWIPFFINHFKTSIENGEFLVLFYHSFQKFNLQSNIWNSFQMNFWRFFVDKMDKKKCKYESWDFWYKILWFELCMGVEKLEKFSVPFYHSFQNSQVFASIITKFKM